MRKIAAILLVCLYTFNLVGYHFVFHLLEKNAERNLQASLDTDAYSEADLITLTMPLQLPYISDTHSYERVDGEITRDGRIYHFVKRAIRNGVLVLLCLPDRQKMQLESAKENYAKIAGDIQGAQPSKKNEGGRDDLIKLFKAKYLKTIKASLKAFPVPATNEIYGYTVFRLASPDSRLPEQPPELS